MCVRIDVHVCVCVCSRRLPHPIWDVEGADVCVIVKDKSGEGHERMKNALRSEREAGRVTRIAKVIGISKLKTKYKQFEARRRLRDSYDLFCCDDRVIEMMPALLGKTFFKYVFSTPLLCVSLCVALLTQSSSYRTFIYSCVMTHRVGHHHHET